METEAQLVSKICSRSHIYKVVKEGVVPKLIVNFPQGVDSMGGRIRPIHEKTTGNN